MVVEKHPIDHRHLDAPLTETDCCVEGWYGRCQHFLSLPSPQHDAERHLASGSALVCIVIRRSDEGSDDRQCKEVPSTVRWLAAGLGALA